VSAITLHIGDVFEQLAKIPDGSIDLIVTSPPFLALRSYLPDDHPDKGKEIGSESGPAAFLDTMMALSAEWGRVLAPHGSLCVELGDTYSGSGGAGGDYNADGLRDGQQRFSGSAAKRAALGSGDNERPSRSGRGDDWPMSKSKTMLDTLYPACLAYGRNLLAPPDIDYRHAAVLAEHLGAERALTFLRRWSPSGATQFAPWRIRNLIVWARPNPPVGALGDKFRPATSYITVACKSPRRWFDLDAVRTEPKDTGPRRSTTARDAPGQPHQAFNKLDENGERIQSNPAGAPPLDWHADDHPEDGDWLWKMSPQGFAGSHYATFPVALPTRLIKAMCPERVCTVCGVPSERITAQPAELVAHAAKAKKARDAAGRASWTGTTGENQLAQIPGQDYRGPTTETVGWTDCECSPDGTHWRTGRVLDPFAGSGTTLVAAHNESRDAIGIDLDSRNVAMVEDRLGPLVAACDLTVNTDQEAAA
jgi:DNA modification methylase